MQNENVLAFKKKNPIVGRGGSSQFVEALVRLHAANPQKALRQLGGINPNTVARPRECIIFGLMHYHAQQKHKALMWFDRALSLDQSTADAAYYRGLILLDLGQKEKALGSFDRALVLGLHAPELHYQRGIILRSQGQSAEAINAFDMALRLRPDYPEVLLAGGEILAEANQYGAALEFFSQALKLQPGFVQAAIAKSNLLQALGRSNEALQTIHAALELNPRHAGLLNNCGVLNYLAGENSSALDYFDEATSIEPNLPQVHYNRGNVHLRLNRPGQALDCYDRAIRLNPQYEEAFCSRAVALKELGRFDEAMNAYDLILAKNPGLSHAKNNRAALHLLLGDLKKGFGDGYEFRWSALGSDPPPIDLPQWNGKIVKGLKIFIFDEQGLGDAIQFSRYLRLVAQAGLDATFFCRRGLHRLFATLDVPIRITDWIDPEMAWDCQIALCSLPRVFGTTLETIHRATPNGKPYLSAEPALIAKWRDYLGQRQDNEMRAGICWHGSVSVKADPSRSIPLSAFAPLANIPGLRLISLQKHDGLEELENMPEGVRLETITEPFDTGEDHFIDTAALMQNLDLIITCDTSMAHLAGALGRPVWVILKKIPDWRWHLDREDSPWYPTMRLFRQQEHGNWTEVFERAAEALKNLRGAATVEDTDALG